MALPEVRSPVGIDNGLARRSAQLGSLPVSTVIGLVFNFLILAALLALLAWTRTIRQPKGNFKRLPPKSLPCSIASFTLGTIFNIARYFLALQKFTIGPAYIAMSILSYIFYLVTFVLLLYAFHQIIQRYLERVASGRRTVSVTAIAHSIILSFLSALAGADCGLWVAYWVRDSGPYRVVNISFAHSILSSVRIFLFFIASLEILGWVIFFVVPKRTPQFNPAKSGAHSLLAGSIFFALLNLALTIVTIISTLLRDLYSVYLEVVYPIVYFVTLVGMFSALISCYNKWVSSNSDYKSVQNPEDPEGLATYPSYQPYGEGLGQSLPGDPPAYSWGEHEGCGRY